MDPSNVPEKGPVRPPDEPKKPLSWDLLPPKIDMEAQLAADPRGMKGTGWNAKTWYPRPEDVKERLLDTVYRWETDGVWGYPIDGSPRFRLEPLRPGDVLGYTDSHDEHSDRSRDRSRDHASPPPSGDEGQAQSSAPGPCPSCGHQGPAQTGWGPGEVVSACFLFMAFGYGLGYFLAYSVNP